MSSSRTADQNGISDFVQNHQKPLFSIPYLEEPLGEVGGRGLVSFRLIHSLCAPGSELIEMKARPRPSTLPNGSSKVGYCNFKENFNDFIIIKYESGHRGIRNVASQFDDIFTLAGVPSHHRAVIRKEMLVGRTIHSTSGTTLRRHVEMLLYSNRTLLQMITQLYYYDFIVFGFKFPNLTEISQRYETSTRS
ncbi:hypothetical protein Y032_0082g1540 [Ancylostoma ceylanicum]|uniref:Uncharacterized protein n=2 Tax=Ancylostoma ceylanicum TaxID=53326 RepID=A0A016TSI6_9BILA|nr:hypothetical protein Y032_0082g1540 [Ancylostoma ceylanicum]